MKTPSGIGPLGVVAYQSLIQSVLELLGHIVCTSKLMTVKGAETICAVTSLYVIG